MSKLINLELVLFSNNFMVGDVFVFFVIFNVINNFMVVDFILNELIGIFFVIFDVKRLMFLKVMLFGSNNFYGLILLWVWIFLKLQLLDLKNNSFFGQLFVYFDNFWGFIDEFFNNFNISLDGFLLSYILSVIIEVVGVYVMYFIIFDWVIFMQLLCNNFLGVILIDIIKFVKMKFLDLLRNQFEGEILMNMGVFI